MQLETLAIHAGQMPDPTTGAVMAPIHLSTTFERQRRRKLSGRLRLHP
jgi:O-acetylhomoserine/O-acetylserine sulfhydrylase-like pyridoxal-dependent enzyme